VAKAEIVHPHEGAAGFELDDDPVGWFKSQRNQARINASCRKFILTIGATPGLRVSVLYV
jgi:hypothetical protein